MDALFEQRTVSGVTKGAAATFATTPAEAASATEVSVSGAAAREVGEEASSNGNNGSNGSNGSSDGSGGGSAIKAPTFDSVGNWTHEGQGFTVDFVLDAGSTSGGGDGGTAVAAGQAILDGRTATGRGIAVVIGSNNSIVMHIQDGDGNALPPSTVATEPPTEQLRQRQRPPTPMRTVLQTDPMCSAVLASPGKHHVGIVLDAGPMVVTFVVDGLVCDGGYGKNPAGVQSNRGL